MPILPRGHHTFPFRFQLPESSLPCSFESKSGTIRYYIKVSSKHTERGGKGEVQEEERQSGKGGMGEREEGWETYVDRQTQTDR